jgi:hypothetical protein
MNLQQTKAYKSNKFNFQCKSNIYNNIQKMFKLTFNADEDFNQSNNNYLEKRNNLIENIYDCC